MLCGALVSGFMPQLRAQGAGALAALQDSVRVDSNDAVMFYRLGAAYAAAKRFADARAIWSARETRVCLVGLGQLEEGFKEYEIRHTPQFRAWQLHYTKAPLWCGEPLSGKRILVVGEQEGLAEDHRQGSVAFKRQKDVLEGT